MSRTMRGLLLGWAVLGAACGPGALQARAEEYVLGPEDVIAVSVWLHPELERTVAIGSDGAIVYPPIGSVKAAGLSPKQLGAALADRLSTYLRQSATVTVTVSQYLSRSVFVSGAVASPGRYGFEEIPGLIEVIGRAGGAQPGADLGQVQILRREGDVRRALVVDLSSALRGGPVAQLPELKPGDTVVVPATGLGGVGAGQGVGVLGEVAKPGIYAVGDGQDLWAVLAVAGGLTSRGDLARVRVVTRQDRGQAVVTVDLRGGLQRRTSTPFVVRAGDIVFVSATGASTLGRMGTGFVQVLSVSRDLLNIAVLADILQRKGN